MNQCGDICRDMHNQHSLKCEFVSQIKREDTRKNVFEFMIEHIKLSKSDTEKEARNIISCGLGHKAGIPRGRVVSL